MQNQLISYARSMRHELFAERNTLWEAIKYAETLAGACATPVAVMTAVHVVLNTVSADLIKIAGPRPTMDHDQCLTAAQQMSEHGGGFAGAIADAYMRADRTNAAILREAFAHLFERYKQDEPPTFAIMRDRNGAEMSRIKLSDSDPLDCDHFAAIMADQLGLEIDDSDARIPDGTEDYNVTITDDPEGVRCWSSANYMMAQE